MKKLFVVIFFFIIVGIVYGQSDSEDYGKAWLASSVDTRLAYVSGFWEGAEYAAPANMHIASKNLYIVDCYVWKDRVDAIMKSKWGSRLTIIEAIRLGFPGIPLLDEFYDNGETTTAKRILEDAGLK